jgi:putative redox protein
VKISLQLALETVESGLRLRITTPNGLSAKLDSGAGAIAPNPVQMLLASTAACVAMDVISILRKKREAVTAYEIEASGERRDEHPRALTSIDIVHRVRGRGVSLASVEDAVRLSSTKYCSVTHSLDPRIPVTHTIEISEAT